MAENAKKDATPKKATKKVAGTTSDVDDATPEAKDKAADKKDKSDKKDAAKDKAGKKKKRDRTKDKGEDHTPKPHAPGSNRWVVPTFIALALLGVLWMVVFYLSSVSGFTVPLMDKLGYWNLAIGMGLLAIALGLTTQWK